MVKRGGKPAWFVRKTTNVRGRLYPNETDGYDRRAGRPKPSAYRTGEVFDGFAGTVQSRVYWYLWAMATD